MPAPWQPDKTVSLELAASLVAEQFPELVPVRAELLGEGWDNTAVLVNGRYVFRFPRREFALPFFRNELSVLPAIARRLPLAVPDPTMIGRPDERFGWPFAGYRRIEGRTACVAALTDAQRAEAAEPLARFLAALHSIGPEEAAHLGAEPDTIGRLDLGKRVPRARESLAQARGLGLIADSDAGVLGQLIEEAASDAGQAPGAFALVHGDLYASHLLVDDDGRLTGVIDWGDVHLGHPAVDLAIAHSFLPPAARERFCRVYGPVAEPAWRLARFRALYHSLLVAIYAHETGRPDMRREAIVSLRHVAEG